MTRPAWLPPWTDLLLAGGFVALVAAEGVATNMWVSSGGDTTIDSPLLYLAIGLPAMAGLALRRRFPIAIAVWVLVANFFINPDGKTSTVLAVAVGAYSIGAHSRHPWHGLAVAITVFFGYWVAFSALPIPSDAAAGLVFLAAPWAAGRFVASRDRSAGAAEERAELLEREQHALALAAAAEERVRLARELHDVVSHSISVVAVQTQAVRRRLGPEHQREIDDLVAVESTAREAMAELRRLFGVLRSDDVGVALAPQPGLGELDQLVEHVRGTGLDVRLEREGPTTKLQPGVDLAAYRIVQEALTNAMRHSGARTVTVTVRQRPDALDLDVEDDGRGLTSASHGGHGLIGIRERAELYGGTLEIGASPAGGVAVRARLPLNGVPA